MFFQNNKIDFDAEPETGEYDLTGFGFTSDEDSDYDDTHQLLESMEQHGKKKTIWKRVKAQFKKLFGCCCGLTENDYVPLANEDYTESESEIEEHKEEYWWDCQDDEMLLSK